MRHFIALAALTAGLTAMPLMAQPKAPFHAGPVFTDFGNTASVDTDLPISAGTEFKILFDNGQGAKPGEISRTLDSAARFINMTVGAGVPLDHVHVAVVLHGPAGWDVTTDSAYAASHDGKANGSAKAVAQLLAHGVQIYICGQSAAGMGIAKSDLLPGVKLALSAMVADALLQQQGYTLIP